MVLKRRSEYGLVGFDALVIPRARRSIRKKGSSKKTFDEDQLCAFELLATLAGKLLQETESSSSASSSAANGPDHLGTQKDRFIKQEMEGPLRIMQDDQGSSEESVVSSGLRSLKCSDKDANKEMVKNASHVDSSAFSGKMGYSDERPAALKSDDRFGQLPGEVNEGSPKCGECLGTKSVDNGIATMMEEGNGSRLVDNIFASANKFRPKDGIVGLGEKSPPRINSNDDGNIMFEHLTLERGSLVPDASFVRHKNDVKIGSSREDNEILSQRSDPSISHVKACSLPTRVGDKKINKTLTSKYWRSAPKLKDFKVTNSGSKVNNIYQSRKSFHSHERFQHHDTPFKKRKLFGPSSVVTQDRGVSSESVSNSTKKGVCDNPSSGPVLKPHKDNGVSSPAMDHQSSFTSKNSHVKLSIKSFKVPELLIQVSERITVGSLKKTVLEAVTRVFGGGLRVGLLLNGKRICDDGRTLLQTGLSEENTLDNLGFLLEPNYPSTLASPTLSPEGSPILPNGDSPKDLVNRPHLTPKVESNLLDTLDKTSVTNSGKFAGSSHQDLVPFVPPSEMERKHVSDSRAVVAVPENVDALAVVPSNQRPRRSEIGQRRTRRPFSVSEVEALVQAVEKLGTGRWRDVKLCAFENAKHRTYVDLKDKWKTLVHTARISPQQRRGEPVPQELLDRVLAAHAYWSQHQAKQHGKQQLYHDNHHHQHHHHHHQAPLPIEKVAA